MRTGDNLLQYHISAACKQILKMYSHDRGKRNRITLNKHANYRRPIG